MPPSQDEVRTEMNRFSWYHTIDLGNGLVTPGEYDLRPLLPHYGLPASFAGQSVIDVGPGNGFFALEFERRGAATVKTLELARWTDHDASDVLRQRFVRDHDDEGQKDYLHGAIEFALATAGSKVERMFGTIYDLDPARHGSYDVTFCGSLILHLSDPFRAFCALRRVTKGYAVVSTLCEEGTVSRPGVKRTLRSVLRRLAGREPGNPLNPPFAVFVGQPEGMVFWSPNRACLERWALAAGFSRVEVVSSFVLSSVDGRFNTPHVTIRAHV